VKAVISRRWMESPRPLRYVFALVCIAATSACNPQTAPASRPGAAGTPAPAADTNVRDHNLTIYGYNYTDTEIGSFEVNGQGGGNVEVSTLTAGGGKSVCCVTARSPMLQPRMVKIKWTRDSENWCEQEVMLKPPLPLKPKYFEVHFYPDGHIELAVTEMDSAPRLALNRMSRAGRHEDERQNVNNDAKFARCKRGYR
jgi:Protein of unknown function (DUF3304)